MSHKWLMNIIIWNITWVITCALHVASQTRIFFWPSANTNDHEWTTNYSWIIIRNITWGITCELHVASQTRNSFVWDWKELERIRKNSAQELETKLFVIIGCHSFSFFVILFYPNINLKRMRVIAPRMNIILCVLRDILCVLR